MNSLRILACACSVNSSLTIILSMFLHILQVCTEFASHSLKYARHVIISMSLQTSTSLGVLIRPDAAEGRIFTMNIYRTSRTVSSHPTTRVSECPHQNVASYAVTTCVSFVSKDAIVPKCSEDRPTVIKHDIRMTVHTQRCVLCVCGSTRIGLIYPTLLLLGSLGPN